MNADIWITAMETLGLALLGLHVIIGALLGWLMAVIARWPIWLGILLCVVLPGLGFLIMAIAALVRQSKSARPRVGSRRRRLPAGRRAAVAAVPAVAILALAATLVLPWFRIPVQGGLPVKVAGHALGADIAVLVTLCLLLLAVALAALSQPAWSGVVQTLSAGFWSTVTVVVLVLLEPMRTFLADWAALSVTVDEGLDRVGVDPESVPDIPEIPIPDELRGFVPFLPTGSIDTGSIDVIGELPSVDLRLGLSWWFVLAAIGVLVGFSVWTAIAETRSGRRGHHRSSPNLGEPAEAGAPMPAPAPGAPPGGANAQFPVSGPALRPWAATEPIPAAPDPWAATQPQPYHSAEPPAPQKSPASPVPDRDHGSASTKAVNENDDPWKDVL